MDNRTPKLADSDNQIDTLSDELTNKAAEQTELQEQINKTQAFLDDNPLPSARQHRLNRANVLLAQLDSQQKQLESALMNQAKHEKKVSSLKREIKKLSNIYAEQLSKRTAAEATLKSADADLKKLLAIGTQAEWNDRKQSALEAQRIAQQYEAAESEWIDSEGRLEALSETQAELTAELGELGKALTHQKDVYRAAVKRVERCNAERESALLANPINKLRQHLHTGEPCLVCGATEHPYAGNVEPEDADLPQNAKDALEDAKTELQAAQDQMQALETRQIETERDQRNTDQQIEDCESEIGILCNKKVKRLAEWQAIYPSDNLSSDWTAKQIEKADAAIAAIGAAEQAQTAASHAYELVSQQLESCQNDINREGEALNDSEKQLQDTSEAVADLQTDLTSTEKRFWEFLPETFHGVAPDVAVNQFRKKIEEVEAREDKLGDAKTQLKLLDAKIETAQANLENLQKDRGGLQAEIEAYRHNGEVLLDTAREKTSGLETEDEIDAAIDALKAELQAKESRRDGAEQQLRGSQQRLTEKETAHKISEKQHKESCEKFETARRAYFDKLADAGFDSPEAHDEAFRDAAQIQELTDQIDAHENEMQQLALEITELRTRFEETPFDPKDLERIETQNEQLQSQVQETQQEIGAQQQKINDLKNALEKREALGGEIAEAEAELRRWKTLQDTIPKNDLRDFALEIMFKQMGALANEQLKFLTSERYQLKVESIGDLTVIDRWNANEERPVETLSGGESFLTSLALALALADLSRGRAELNSLFLDEGFGTLDTETLDIAIAALEGLRMQGRSIFLISHIQELTRRLPIKINVKKQGNDTSDNSFSSSIEIRG